MTSKGSERPYEPDPKSSGLVPVIYAANRVEAEFYQTLLADADIQTVIDSDVDRQIGLSGKGIAVLVPAELLDGATDIITVREEMEAHILAGPDGRDKDAEEDEEDEEDELDDDNTEDGEDFLFHRDLFIDEDGF